MRRAAGMALLAEFELDAAGAGRPQAKGSAAVVEQPGTERHRMRFR